MITSGHVPAMARNLVGLLVALLLCGGHVQGRGAESPPPVPEDGVERTASSPRAPTDADADADADAVVFGTPSTPRDVDATTLNTSEPWTSDAQEGVVPASANVGGSHVGSLKNRDDTSLNATEASHSVMLIASRNSTLKTRSEHKNMSLNARKSSNSITLTLASRNLTLNASSDHKNKELNTKTGHHSVVVLTSRNENSENVSETKDEGVTLNRVSAKDTAEARQDSNAAADSNGDRARGGVAKGRRSATSPSTAAETSWDSAAATSTAMLAMMRAEDGLTTAATGEASWEARRRQRQATAQQEEAAEMVPACRKFVEGNPERREFHSPNFPGNYPNNTDCVKVLAAEPGHLLRLDFRDEFHVEPSEGCRFDYLEVRDGAHGYENLIGTFCGKDFPPMMTSSGRHLWLRFHSDENIEYSGFTAVYESIPKPTTEMDHYELPECVIEVGGSEGFLNTTADIEPERRRMVAHYALKLECMWIIRVKPGWRIQLSFLKFELSKPNDCVSNFVDVFSDRTDLPSRLKSFCGSIADMVTSKSHVLHVRFLAEAKAINSTFVALFTAFRDSKLSGSVCTRDEFDCQDETCISAHLRCNGRINCRFRWDEDECSTKISPMEKILRSDHIIIILVVFSLIMFGMCFAFVFNCVRKLMHDHKVIQENFRVSREGRLDEIGVKLPSPRQPSVASSTASRRPSATRDTGVGVPECYVPGALLPILVDASTTAVAPHLHHQRPSNGDAVFARRDAELTDDDDVDEDDDDDALIGFPPPEMRDNECQTRESLFHGHSERSVTPPPPPPPPAASRHPHHHPHHHHQHPPPPPGVGQFSTFGYTRDNRREDRVKEAVTRPPAPPPPGTSDAAARFRAEAVIEMEGRGFSVDSTKSAPDVIVTH